MPPPPPPSAADDQAPPAPPYPPPPSGDAVDLNINFFPYVDLIGTSAVFIGYKRTSSPPSPPSFLHPTACPHPSPTVGDV